MLLLNLVATLPAQSVIKPRGDSVLEAQLKRELAELRKVVLQKIEFDLDDTSRAFAESENMFRSLRMAYSFKTVMDSIKNSFELFGIMEDVIDGIKVKNLIETTVDSSLALGSIFLVVENMKENAGKLEMVFNSGRYVENVKKMVKEAGSSQPTFGFDVERYRVGIKSQLQTKWGQEVLNVVHRNAKAPCQAINPVGEIRLEPLKGSTETRHYISDVFQKLEKEASEGRISDTNAKVLITLIQQTKQNVVQSNLSNLNFTLALPRSSHCDSVQTKITLGRIAPLEKALASTYAAQDKNLKIEQFVTVKTAAEAMLSATTYYFKDGDAIKEVVEATGKVSLAIELGDLVNKKFTRQEVDPAELIGSLPQEMLMALPSEFSELVLMVDTLDSFVRKLIIRPQPEPLPFPETPEIPTLFLFDVSGSMNDNNKIEQVRTAGLRALDEMKENRRRGQDNSTVSIWTFNGGCSPNAAREILPFTSNLVHGETAMRSQIPRPDGGTPLPQGIERSSAQLNDYLNVHPNINLGRLVILSDGQSTCGDIRPAGTYSQAKVILYPKLNILTVGYGIQVGSQAERDLQYLASASGGRYFPASNGGQLSRAFEKAIRVYLPKTVASPQAEFAGGVQAILNRDFSSALQIFTAYVQTNPSDSLGYYNLAVACEALELYKSAAENYRKYLSLAPNAADASEIRIRIGKADEDYRDKLLYHANLLRSDLEYLKAYYQRLSGLRNKELATEFAGFVSEKRTFYANLPKTLEIKASWLGRGSEELADSLGRLNSRVNSPSFDLDALSLLTLPIGQLEELVERLDVHNAQVFR